MRKKGPNATANAPDPLEKVAALHRSGAADKFMSPELTHRVTVQAGY